MSSDQERPDGHGDHSSEYNEHGPVSVRELHGLPAAINQHRTDSKEQNARDKRRFKMEVFGLILVAAAAGFAATSAYFLHVQTNTLVEQVHSGDRAYLLIESLQLIDPIAVGNRAIARYEMKNAGKTPALSVGVGMRLVFLKEPPPVVFPIGNPPSLMNLGAGDTNGREIWLEGFEAGHRWTQTDLDRLKTERLYVLMFAGYRTVYNEPGWTSLCGYWEGGQVFTLCPANNVVR